MAFLLLMSNLSMGRTQAAEENIALHKNVTVSSLDPASAGKQNGENAVDGDSGTRWTSNRASGYDLHEWIVVDLEGTYLVDRVELDWEGAYGKEYTVQVSTDGENYQTVATVTDGKHENRVIEFAPAVASYLKVDFTKKGSDRYGYSIWELRAFGEAFDNANVVQNEGVTASASGTENNSTVLTAEKAIDGKTGVNETRWSGAKSDNQWLLVDLGQVYTLEQINIDFFREAAAYTIEVSKDGENYQEILKVENNTLINMENVREIVFDAQEVRYIKYNQTQMFTSNTNNQKYSGSIYEIEAYKKAKVVQTSDSIAITSPIGNANKLLDLKEDNTFAISGTYTRKSEGALALKAVAKGPDFNSQKAIEEEVLVTDLVFNEDGTWTGSIPQLNIYGSMTLDVVLIVDDEAVAEDSVSNLIYRGKHNLARDAKPIAVASHSGYPATRLNDGVFAPGDNNTRWSVTGNVDGKPATNVWIGMDFGKDVEFDRIVLTEWQARTSEYVIEYAKDADIEDPNNNQTMNADGWTAVKTGTTIGTDRVIDFSESVTGRYVRLRTTAYSQAQPGFTEFEVYKADSPVIDADGLGAPILPEGDSGKVVLPNVSNGTITLYGSDNKQIIDMEGNFYRPLVDMSINVMYEASVENNGKISYSEKDTQVIVPGKHKDHGVNPTPKVVPGIREWYGSSKGGQFKLTDTKVAANGHESAERAADKTKAFFEEMLGFTLEGTDAAKEGDIEFVYDENLAAELGEEGYYLTIGEKITITSGSETGLLYGGITLTQIFYASDDYRTAPYGEARDYPKYEIRGGMIDIARSYFPLDYLEEVGHYMAWFKLNNLQVHLGDGWDNTGYAAFRLESDTYPLIKYNGQSSNPGGANEGYYTKDAYRQFQKNLEEYGVEVISEIDTPAHSMVFGRLSEEEGRPPMRTAAHMNIDTEENRKEVEEFVLNLVDEYTAGEDPVFLNGVVHFGGDEYSGPADALALYNMDMTTLLRERDLEVRMWSSGATLSKNVDSEIISDPNVMINIWHPAELSGGGGVKAAYEKGYNIINTCNFLYIDPANYNGYPDRYGGIYYQDGSNPSDYTFEHIYDVFNVNNTYTPRRGNAGSALMPLAHPQTKGAQMVLWNDIASYNGGISEFDMFDRFKEGVMMVSEKTWYGEQTEGQTWENFKERIDKQWNKAGGANPARFVESVSDTIASYDFAESLQDVSENGYDATVEGNYEEVSAGIKLSDEANVKLPFDAVGFPYSVNLKAKLADVPENTVLFDGKDGTLYANFNGTGHLGYVRGEYGLEYHFEYKDLTTTYIGTQTQPQKLSVPRVETVPDDLIAQNEWFDLTLVCEKTYPVHSNTNSQFRGVESWTDVALYVNGERIVSRATNVWINNGKKFQNSGSVGKRSNTQYDSTSFVLPTEKILANSEAVVNGLTIFNRDLTADEVKELYKSNLVVEFESNGGSLVKAVHPNGDGIVKEPAAPVKEGAVFAGWYQDAELSDAWDFTEGTTETDIVLYAKWDEQPVQTDKEDLEALIDYANEAKDDPSYKYVVARVKELFEKALADAITVDNEATATQTEIDEAYDALLKTVHLLEFKGNMERLESLVVTAREEKAEKYTEESWTAFAEALQEAETILAEGNTLQAEVDAARAKLLNAIFGLREVPNKDKLESLLGKVKAMDLSAYSAETASAVKAAYAAAVAVFEDENADQEKVDAAVAALEKAVANVETQDNASGNGSVSDEKDETSDKKEETSDKVASDGAGSKKTTTGKTAGTGKTASNTAAKTGDGANAAVPVAAGFAAILATIIAWKKKEN